MLDRCHNISDLRKRAHRRLPAPIFDVLEGAAESELTAQRNIAAFDELTLIPKCMVDVGHVNTSARILGQPVEWPVICSPTGGSRLFHPHGELAVARAVARAGTLYSLSTASTYGIEEVAAASNGPKMFQLFVCKDRDLTRDLIRRAKRSGYGALCITVNVPVVGQCERDLRTRIFDSPLRWPIRTVVSFARHPSWIMRRMRGRLGLANFLSPDGTPAALGFLATQLDPSITWKDVREITDLWDGPVALKGVMSSEIVRRAADCGITAVIVSNHGGRQLDGSIASIEALQDIVLSAGGRLEVILDGGIRRGVHVLKALALGASACSIGRVPLYGLGAGGEAGVERALCILRAELVRAMQLAGCPDLASVDESFVRWSCERNATTRRGANPHLKATRDELKEIPGAD
jgi:L-lactate dehydrogenase (cytochrome)